MGINELLGRWMVAYLTRELPGYQRRIPNDLVRMRAHLAPGDVVLVEGRSRISQIIMYLTQSSWSHAAMYIGDALLRHGGPHAEAALAKYGAEAADLLIESDLKDGVIVVPLSKYRDHNLRVCRPWGLSLEERERVLGEMIRHLGVQYDRRNIFDLGRYLTPFHLLPRRWRKRPLYLGSSSSREVICSALIAKALYKVGYPIQPMLAAAQPEPRPEPEGESLLELLGAPPRPAFRARHPSYIMPRDFDLSPNFEILKAHLMGAEDLDLRRLA